MPRLSLPRLCPLILPVLSPPVRIGKWVFFIPGRGEDTCLVHSDYAIPTLQRPGESVLCQGGQRKVYARPGVAPSCFGDAVQSLSPSFSVQRTWNSTSTSLPELHFLRQHFGYSPWFQVSHCVPPPPKHHTASSTNNLDIPDVTVLVFRHKPPHFALAQRGQATCPRSHSRAGEQMGPLTTNPECFWGTPGCGWFLFSMGIPLLPLQHDLFAQPLLGGHRKVPVP